MLKQARLYFGYEFSSEQICLVGSHVDGRQQLIFDLAGSGVGLSDAGPMDHLLALQNFEDAEAHDVEPFVMGEAGGKLQYPTFVLP